MALRTTSLNRPATVGLITGFALAVAVVATGCGSSSASPSDAKAADGGVGKDANGNLFPGDCMVGLVIKSNDLNGVPAPHVVADFTYVTGATDGFSWGSFANDGTFSGYTYTYPATVTQDISGSNWHIAGMVGDYAGAGMGFTCQNDVSMFTGISFSIKGNAGSTTQMLLAMGTAPDDVNKMTGSSSLGRCVPAVSEYDGTCLSPRVVVPVSTAPATHKFKWADFIGGKPQASVDSKAISSLAWSFDWIAGATPFMVDVTIDDIVFTVD